MPVPSHTACMQMALVQAEMAFKKNEIPIGAVIVRGGQIIAQAFNSCEQDQNPLQHAELKAIQIATTHTRHWRLNDCSLYVTLEPCPMCLGALFQARIGHLLFGCHDHKRAVATQLSTQSIFISLKDQTELKDNNHALQITGGVLANESSALLKRFFEEKRK